MEPRVYTALLFTLYLRNTVTAAGYSTYNLENFHMCGHGNKESASLFIQPWNAAILKVGYLLNRDGSQSSKDIHRCKVKIETAEGFGLAAVIEEMKIRGTKDLETNGWHCEDYVKMSTTGTSFISKLFDSLLPGDLFKSKTTERLCGLQQNKRDGESSFRFSEVGSNANVISTLASHLTVEFHQEQSNNHPVNNYFTVVITSYKHEKDNETCKGKYICQGSNTYQYCIDPRYKCDSHFNCAFPYSGSDEKNCEDRTIEHPIFSTTTTIITTLASIVGAGLVVCCLFTIIMRAKSRSTTPSGTPVPRSTEATAPPLQRQHTLPGYEAVVMSDINRGWKADAPPSPEPGECPPSYNALFPDGPPKDMTVENATVPKDRGGEN